ncbi:hypothetical protein AG1IA_00172 [Rhizoctonia solani AG-1 IA]|uniref:Secreted protein n=1 Tax=Thanatephorus cucumeris (strain AG1-IA) TaxID=983506 RepID=L8XAW4_THACA|nr:hypothetical protein AG1IA_00172 [Rhizoctonia solani AG-1 IA]
MLTFVCPIRLGTWFSFFVFHTLIVQHKGPHSFAQYFSQGNLCNIGVACSYPAITRHPTKSNIMSVRMSPIVTNDSCKAVHDGAATTYWAFGWE